MNECPDWEVLAAPASWSAEVRGHVEGCARCLAWRREHEAFLAGDPAIPAAERDAAHARLTAFTRELTGVDAPVAAAREPGRGFFARHLAPLFAPPLRLAGALAVIAIVSAVMVARREPSPARIGEATRGERAVATATANFDAQGRLQLRWEPVAGADDYAIELLDVTMAPVWTGDTTATAFGVDPAVAPNAAYARVVAKRRGDRLRELAPVPLPAR